MASTRRRVAWSSTLCSCVTGAANTARSRSPCGQPGVFRCELLRTAHPLVLGEVHDGPFCGASALLSLGRQVLLLASPDHVLDDAGSLGAEREDRLGDRVADGDLHVGDHAFYAARLVAAALLSGFRRVSIGRTRVVRERLRVSRQFERRIRRIGLFPRGIRGFLSRLQFPLGSPRFSRVRPRR
jgi:hypothetical protein